MQADYSFVCNLAHGLHGRPASILAAKAGEFSSSILLRRQVENPPAPADVRSVLSIIGLDIHLGETCRLTAEGTDAAEAIAALRDLIEHRLEQIEAEAEASGPRPDADVRLPVILKRLGVAYAGGRAVCAGAGMGRVVIVGGLTLPADAAAATPADAGEELRAARRAVDAVRADLTERSRGAGDATERALLAAHAEIANDPALWDALTAAIRGNATAPQAVLAAAEQLAATLRGAATAYVRERALDVQDIAMQLLDRLLPESSNATQVDLAAESVVFAEALTANQLLRMDRSLVKGLVLGAVGPTSHTVILARNFGIPCIIDVVDVAVRARAGDTAVVDGDGGFMISPVPPEVARFYERERAAQDRRLARLVPLACRPAVTTDGRGLEVATNAADAAEIGHAVAMGADGVGLFRTEFLFLDRESAPDEGEQFDIYAAAVQAAAGRPIIFRTFDIGGDKPAPYMRIPGEENPFLGCRGLRLYRPHLGLLRTQLRALIRAAGRAPSGTVKIMAPMVAEPGEAAWFRGEVETVCAELGSAGAAGGEIPIGIMVEVPSVALSIDLFAPHVDFLSIGTNDLCQYWMAADRGNAGVATLCDPHHPSFLRVLRLIVGEARRHGKWIGVCGEMGGRLRDLPLMIGLGVDEISGSARQVASLKLGVAAADSARCRALLDAACDSTGPEGVEALLDGHVWRGDDARAQPVIDPGCILVGADASSKEEAIRQAVDLLWIAGRTDAPRPVEEAVWAREETYSTGLGHGFAVPHCKCDAVSAPTLAVLKLEQPIEWGSMDDKPVTTVLLLAVPASESGGGGAAAHMKIFATLARRLMHEEFRDALDSLRDPGRDRGLSGPAARDSLSGEPPGSLRAGSHSALSVNEASVRM
ncbi:MAG: phosphoenolpyruvate--protein phosphotransferase [Phycisphaerales bacterium]|nr:phosphoenolpyruvate--protein phosphotransferase [Phycisphaerales bacterium]